MIQKIHQELKATLLYIRRKKKLTMLFQKITWSFTGIYFLFILLMQLNTFLCIPLPEFVSLKNLASSQYLLLGLVVTLMVLIQVSAIIFGKLLAGYTEEEQSAVEKMIRALFPAFTYHSTTYLVKRELAKSRIFAWFDDSDERSDQLTYGYMKGKVEDVSMHISDIGLVEKNIGNRVKKGLMSIPYTYMFIAFYEFIIKNIFTNKSADNVYYTFRGLFCWAEFNKHINGYTVVLTDKLESKIGPLAQSLQSLNFRRDQLVSLEDPLFEKEFVVYSTDQVEARYILSTSLMEKIYEVKQKFGKPLMLSFFDNKIYIAIHIPSGVFSINPDHLDSYKAVEEIYNYICTSREIITDLSLNRKIWKKPAPNSYPLL